MRPTILSKVFNDMVGKPLDIDEVKKHHKDKIRIFDPVNNVGTMDMQPNRLNVYVDDSNIVQRFSMG